MHHTYPLFLLLLLFSCGTPLQVVRVEPAREDLIDRYRYGSAIQHQETDEASVEVSFYDATRDYLLFDVEITNHSTEDILIDPAETSLQLPTGTRLSAVEPEYQLLSMDLESVRKQRQSRTLAWASAAVMVAATAYAIANSDNATVSEPNTDAVIISNLGSQVADVMTYVVLEEEGRRLARETVPDAGEMPAPDNRFFWLDYSFRKTTLRPGESAVGKLVFPRADDSPTVEVVVPVGTDGPFIFPFRQRVFRDQYAGR